MKSRKILFAAGCGVLLALILKHPEPVMEACRQAGALWAFRVAPALFPYMILSRLLSDCIRHPALSILLSVLGGAPAGAALLESRKELSERSRQSLSVVCTLASPAFLLGSLSAPPHFLFCHYLSGALVSIFVFLLFRKKTPDKPPVSVSVSPASVSEILSASSGAMITVCGCMAFYASLCALAERFFHLPPLFSALLSAFLEMSGGCARIQSLFLPQVLQNALLCAVVSFGGLSIFTQNAGYLKRCGVRIPLYFFSKLLQGVLAFVLYFLFSFLFL